MTLADITRSYVQQLKKEQHSTGRYTYNGHGSGNGLSGPMGPNGVYAPPTPGTELAEQIYASKLYALLEQSAQAYHDKYFHSMISDANDDRGHDRQKWKNS